MRNRRYRCSAGYSMIEMLMIVSVTTMIMTVTLSWIHASMKFSKTVKDRAIVHTQLVRLSEDLRTRIAVADSIKVEGNTLELDSKGVQTRYTIKERVIERQQQSNPADESAALKMESFRIGRDVDARWGAEELPEWVSLTIRQKPVTAVTDDASTSIGSLETPKLEWHLRAGPRKAAK